MSDERPILGLDGYLRDLRERDHEGSTMKLALRLRMPSGSVYAMIERPWLISATTPRSKQRLCARLGMTLPELREACRPYADPREWEDQQEMLAEDEQARELGLPP